MPDSDGARRWRGRPAAGRVAGHGAGAHGGRAAPGRYQGARTRSAAVAAVVLATVGVVAGCSSAAPLGQPIRVASAYMILAGSQRTVDGYLVIQNIGPADQLVSVSSSKGGTVTFVRSGTVGPADGMPAASGRGLLIPGHSTIRLDPAGTHLVISNSSRLKDGTYITLTLDFAHAGRITVDAQVTNPQNGNYTYFGP